MYVPTLWTEVAVGSIDWVFNRGSQGAVMSCPAVVAGAGHVGEGAVFTGGTSCTFTSSGQLPPSTVATCGAGCGQYAPCGAVVAIRALSQDGAVVLGRLWGGGTSGRPVTRRYITRRLHQSYKDTGGNLSTTMTGATPSQ